MRGQRLLFLVALVGCILACSSYSFRWANAYYQQRALEAGQSTLALVAEAVDQAVGRFVPIPGLIAGEPALRPLLQADTAPGVAPFMNEKLRQIAISIEASEVYIMNRSGLTVAASNYRDADSFLGRNFSYRPYFTQSLAGKSAVFHALGTTSGERGFFYSSPILDGIEIMGVVVVKMTVDEIEKGWQGREQEILIADNNGIVFLTSREAFKFRALAPLTRALREEIAQTKQFPLGRLEPMGLSTDIIRPSTIQVTLSEELSSDRFLAASTPLRLAGWHAIVFTPLAPVQSQTLRAMAFGTLMVSAIVLGGLLVWQRRANILQQMRAEQVQREILEVRVRERTADLDAANIKLRSEVSDRRYAEERLRKSQKELVQAGKLAALGKMSAAISHEINQPLAAIRSYAVNAAEFLKRSRFDEAKTNIDSITTMSDRMAEISRHLRNFARQPGDRLKSIHVSEVIEETIGLVGPQFRAQDAQIVFTPSQDGPLALGGRLRLQQVLVNIITNALEAMSGQNAPKVEIDSYVADERVVITVRDHGPGVSQEDLEQVFDAFYTTKTAGAGMGLGLSISHNIISDFGGSLSVENHPDGGAVFKASLRQNAGAPLQDASQ